MSTRRVLATSSTDAHSPRKTALWSWVVAVSSKTHYSFNFTTWLHVLVGLGLPRAVIGPENFHHPLNQSDAKPKPITTS